MDKEDVVHIHKRILLSRKKLNNAICPNIDGPRDYLGLSLSEVSQTEEDKYHMVSLIRGV